MMEKDRAELTAIIHKATDGDLGAERIVVEGVLAWHEKKLGEICPHDPTGKPCKEYEDFEQRIEPLRNVYEKYKKIRYARGINNVMDEMWQSIKSVCEGGKVK
jgi:hypothetical protein